MSKSKIQKRQEFLDVYNEFDKWLEKMGFRSGHHWRESTSHLDYNYWSREIDSLHGVEHYLNDILQLSIRFLRERNNHGFYLTAEMAQRSGLIPIEEFKELILTQCLEIKTNKLRELQNLNF